MSSTTVVVLCPNGYRVHVPVTPSTSLNAVKSTACEKHAYNPSHYGLRKEDLKKPLDLSCSFRLSGLSNKAKLELFEQEQKSVMINIALQLDTGARLQGRMLNNSSIAEIIESIGNDISEVSHVIYMARKIDKIAFTTVTLADLGILKGSAMLRLHGVKQSTAETPMETNTLHTEAAEEETSEAPMPEPVVVNSEEHKTMETDRTKQDEVTSTREPIVVDKAPILFDPAATGDGAGLEMDSDDFYEVTDKDMRTILRDLYKISERQFKFKDKDIEKEIPDETVIRIRFPNGFILQQIFDTKTTTDALYTFVKDYITPDCAENLTLFLAPPKCPIKQGVSLLDAGLTSTTLLHAGGDIIMKSDLKVGSDTSATQQLCNVLGRKSHTNVTTSSVEDKPETVDKPPVAANKPGPGKGGKAVPKWFKMK